MTVPVPNPNHPAFDMAPPEYEIETRACVLFACERVSSRAQRRKARTRSYRKHIGSRRKALAFDVFFHEIRNEIAAERSSVEVLMSKLGAAHAGVGVSPRTDSPVSPVEKSTAKRYWIIPNERREGQAGRSSIKTRRGFVRGQQGVSSRPPPPPSKIEQRLRRL